VNGRCDHKFTAAEKNMMLLSLETREGLQITGKKISSCYLITLFCMHYSKIICGNGQIFT